MAGYHKVQQGEHIAGIAAMYGFPKYAPIWNHPNNASLRQTRDNPNVLLPGDELYVPDPQTQQFDRPVDQEHTFKLSADPLELLIVLHNIYGKPVAQRPCTLTLGLNQFQLTSDANGLIRHGIPKKAVDASLTVKDQVTVKGTDIPIDRHFQLKIGYLDPVDQPSGQQARLANLGYYRGPAAPQDADEFLSAVEEFQCDNNLTVDGICGPQTQAKLKSVHGS